MKNNNIYITRFGKNLETEKNHKVKCNSLIGVIIFIVISIILISCSTIQVERIIYNFVTVDQKDTWTASIASYWGGIIGGIVSGVFSFLGVFYTIRYYKDSDAQKERAAIMPFLRVKVERNTNSDPQKGFSLGVVPEKKENQRTIYITIQNIGNGFANTLVIHTGYNIGGLAFNRVIQKGDSVCTYFVVDSEKQEELSFGLQFIDSMCNEYLQEYTLKIKNKSVEIECGYPQLIGPMIL